ncbi:MAG TPA: exosortase/archaeosortase family protein [Candidatus Sulfotelmatobacter sp.]
MIKRSPKLAFLLLGAASLVVAWHPLRETFWLATHDEAYTHLLLIFPVVTGLICLEWRSLESLATPSFRAGLALLCISLAVAGFVRWRIGLPPDERLTGNMLALVSWLVGSFVLCFGVRISRALFFLLGFSFLAVPLPRFLVNELVAGLQQGSAVAARCLFWIARVPVVQDGLLLSIPDLTVEIATECSSIRSSSMLLVTTMILAQLLLRASWRKSLVILLAIPLSVAKNGLRIFTIAMLGTRVDPSYLTGRLHHQGGVVFFAIGLGGIFLALWLLHRNERGFWPKTMANPSAS